MIDQERIREAVTMIIEAIGEDPNREGLADTPRRIAEMYAEIFSGLEEDVAQHLEVVFTEEHDEMVLVRDIPLLFHVRAPFSALFRESPRGVHPCRGACHGPEQTCTRRGRICTAPADAGAADESNRGSL